MDESHFVRTYQAHTGNLLESEEDPERALELAIGGGSHEEFVGIGEMQLQLLKAHGLKPDDSLVEVGCGSGRLAARLRGWLRGPYLGIDVVPALLDRAAVIAGAPNMTYQQVAGLTIPCDAGTADVVCAFSVFTHLRHEESYVYMRDCLRVLKPGGTLVFSFLEFSVPAHWVVMEANIEHLGTDAVLNQFMSRDAVEVWATHLGFEQVAIFRGDEAYVPLSRPISLNGQQFVGAGSFGQSAAVLRKPLV